MQDPKERLVECVYAPLVVDETVVKVKRMFKILYFVGNKFPD